MWLENFKKTGKFFLRFEIKGFIKCFLQNLDLFCLCIPYIPIKSIEEGLGERLVIFIPLLGIKINC
ncbi:MAG: hypothetical protein RL308_2059 [Bacteroidota bacterium]|jgi:hypothetical protein